MVTIKYCIDLLSDNEPIEIDKSIVLKLDIKKTLSNDNGVALNIKNIYKFYTAGLSHLLTS